MLQVARFSRLGFGKRLPLSSHILSTLTEVADEASVLVGDQVQRHYAAAEFGTLEAALYGEKLAQLRQLL